MATIIQNKQPRIELIGRNVRTKILDPQTGAHRETTIPGSALQLNPGINQLDDPDDVAAWEAAKNLDVVKHKLKRGDLVDLGSLDGAKPTLEHFSAREAAKLIEDTVDVKLLRRWRAEEKRPAVVKLIDLQLESVDAHAASA